MNKVLGIALLITTLTCSAYAGEMQNGGPENPPSSAPGVMQTGTPGLIPNGVGGIIPNDSSGLIPNGADGVMPNGVAATSETEAVETMLSLLQGMLPALF